MSDMLEKILGVEKNAAVLITEAEAEASHRLAQARADSQKTAVQLMKSKAAEGESALEAERARVAAERERENKAFREKLARHPADTAAFSRAVFAFMEKGGA
jgi:vacuolar-type H+-ATPase subunit H